MKGGGGNFGAVSEFAFQAHRLGPEVLVANLVYSLPRWRAAWRALAEWTSDLPDAMTTITTTMAPPPFLEMGEDPLLIVGCAWADDDDARGLAEVDRLRMLCPADEELVGRQPWVQWQSGFDPAFPKGVRAYWRNASLDRLDDQVIDVLIRRGAEQTWVGTAFDMHHMGGAFARVGQQTSPFPHREARYWVNIYGFWPDPGVDQARMDFVRGMSADLDRFATGGHYVNFQGREHNGHLNLQPVEVFGAHAHQRLVAVKRSFDPDNVFHINHNIAP